MTTPTQSDFGPLAAGTSDTPRRDRTLDLNPPLTPRNSTTPISFKRRTPSRSTGTSKVGNLISNLVSNNSNAERELVPSSFDRPNVDQLNDSRFRAVSESNFSQAIDDDDEEEEGVEDELGSGPNWKRRGGGGARLSFAQGTAPPRLVPPYTRNMASPSKTTGQDGGEGDEAGEAEALPLVVTPLPRIPMTVLCVALFGEFLSASISSPFLFFMVESFGVGKDGGGESAVSLWAGVVAASFFLSQFLTSLLWVSVANKHGRRVVLFASLVGNGLTVILFGASKNLGSAITTRLALGLFNGAVGVARSAVTDVTDDSNRPLAYTLVGLLWGLGGIVGSVLGGVLESPTQKFSFFADSELFAEYPYLLPCLVAGSVTLFGGFLSLFLNRDGGERTGGIHLPTEKDMQVATGVLASTTDWILRQITKLWNVATRRQAIQLDSTRANLHPSSAGGLESPAVSPSILDSERNPFNDRRRTSKSYGSAYGYGRRPSGVGSTMAGDSGLRIPSTSIRRRTGRSVSVATSNRYDPENEMVHSFAERLLLANNQAVFNLSDVFLAKAAADDLVSQRDYEGSVFERTEEDEEEDADDVNSEYGDVGYGSALPSLDDLRGEAQRQDLQRLQEEEGSGIRSNSPAPSLVPPQSRVMRSPNREVMPSFGQHLNRPSFQRLRRGSAASSIRPISIFSNSGLDPDTLASAVSQRPDESGFAPMAAIPETRPDSTLEHGQEEAEKVSPISQLPKFLIFQYSLLALHGTTNDQIFTAFLVAPRASGGLGLEASHYAYLIGSMFFFSLVWQFRFYPSVGPPGGPLSHLSMFRLGLFLYVPVYILVPELRALILVEGETKLVMIGMTVLTSIRYLANACAYTAVMVLINVLTPPDFIPLANGLAQSCVSFARFLDEFSSCSLSVVGVRLTSIVCRSLRPLVGGYLFAASISNKSHPTPEYCFYFIAALCFGGFLASWRIR
ncbi:uncharacterized protein JCM6883_005765 [Sporobolomyces salmoneus]|uniref:uncharacterized protein n=1 Tax=Sporobolomyces salmoneus TaxID=183962 RepID=UPI00317BABF6